MDLNIYFNEWAFLAKTDPELFERRRETYIEQLLIGSGTHRPQLETLQARIDANRALLASPEEAALAITVLMCESLGNLACEVQCLSSALHELAPPPGAPGQSRRSS